MILPGVVATRRRAAGAGSMAGDVANGDALHWHSPDNVTTSGSTLTAWPDNSGNGYNLAAVTGLTGPDWDSTNKCADFFTNYLGYGLRTANNPYAPIMDANGSFAIFTVIEFPDMSTVTDNNGSPWGVTKDNTNGWYMMLYAFDYDAGQGPTGFHFRDNHGTHSQVQAIPANQHPGKHLAVLVVDDRDTALWWDGTEIATTTITNETSIITDSTFGMNLNGRISDSGTQWERMRFKFYEQFGTKNVSATHIADIEAELATKHSITLSTLNLFYPSTETGPVP